MMLLQTILNINLPFFQIIWNGILLRSKDFLTMESPNSVASISESSAFLLKSLISAVILFEKKASAINYTI